MNQEERSQVPEQMSARPEWVGMLLRALEGSQQHKDVVSWFLKRHLEQGATLREDQVLAVYASTSRRNDWETELHILQCMPYLGVPQKSRKHAEAFVRRSLEDSNKFVRAWAYNGFSELAARYSAYRDEALALFGQAMLSEAASVKARLRNLTGWCGEGNQK